MHVSKTVRDQNYVHKGNSTGCDVYRFYRLLLGADIQYCIAYSSSNLQKQFNLQLSAPAPVRMILVT